MTILWSLEILYYKDILFLSAESIFWADISTPWLLPKCLLSLGSSLILPQGQSSRKNPSFDPASVIHQLWLWTKPLLCLPVNTHWGPQREHCVVARKEMFRIWTPEETESEEYSRLLSMLGQGNDRGILNGFLVLQKDTSQTLSSSNLRSLELTEKGDGPA